MHLQTIKTIRTDQPSVQTFADRQAKRRVQEDEMFSILQSPRHRARFEKKVSPEPMSGCWLWSGAVGQHGHGQFFLRGKDGKILIAAHRASWMINRGKLQATELVCHKCDNPYCVNPDHLFLGSHKDNSLDAVAKGRVVMPDTVGEANSAAVLTEADVLYIRQSRKSIKALSLELNVSTTTVWESRTGITWPHLPGAHASTPRNPSWTPDEEALLFDGTPEDEIIRLTGRTRHSIFTRRSKLKKARAA